MDGSRWRLPSEVDTNSPHAARLYDFYLGGHHNFAADRRMGQHIVERLPVVPQFAKENRAFIWRGVRWCIEKYGIRQFLDLGSGLPTARNVHEIAQELDTGCRVVYVDRDPIAVAMAQSILTSESGAVFIGADIRDHEFVLGAAARFLDFDLPIAIIAGAVWHFIPNRDQPGDLLRKYTSTPGGVPRCLVFSHVTHDWNPDVILELAQLYENTDTPITNRSRDEILEILSPYELAPPGLRYAMNCLREDADDPNPERCLSYAAVARIA